MPNSENQSAPTQVVCECGMSNISSSKFCGNCGVEISDISTSTNSPSNISNELRVQPNLEAFIPEMSVKTLRASVVYSEAKFSLKEAREKLIADLTKSKVLPKNMTPDVAVSNLLLTYIPIWTTKGACAVNWSATGIHIEKTRINCSACRGGGKLGRGKNRKNCSSCGGSGTHTQSKKIESSESGIEQISGQVTVLDSNEKVDFDLIETHVASHSGEIIKKELPEKLKKEWKCIRPAHPNGENAISQLKEELLEKARGRIKTSLDSAYDEVSDFETGDANYQIDPAILWLYPVYVSRYEKKGKEQYCICDAITGELDTPINFLVIVGWILLIITLGYLTWRYLL